jgi:hypothetical protein
LDISSVKTAVVQREIVTRKIYSAARPQPGRIEPRIARIARIGNCEDGGGFIREIREIRGKFLAKLRDVAGVQYEWVLALIVTFLVRHSPAHRLFNYHNRG